MTRRLLTERASAGLVDLAMCGCSACFGVIEQRFAARIAQLAKHEAGGAIDRDDAAQEARIGLLLAIAEAKRDGLADDDALTRYAMATMRQRITALKRDLYKDRERVMQGPRLDAPVGLADDALMLGDTVPAGHATDPYRSLLRREAIRGLVRARETLTPDERRALQQRIDATESVGRLNARSRGVLDSLRVKLEIQGAGLADIMPDTREATRPQRRAAIDDGRRRCAWCTSLIPDWRTVHAIYCGEMCQEEGSRSGLFEGVGTGRSSSTHRDALRERVLDLAGRGLKLRSISVETGVGQSTASYWINRAADAEDARAVHWRDIGPAGRLARVEVMA